MAAPVAFLAVDAAGNNYIISGDLTHSVPVSSADAAALTTAGWGAAVPISTALVSSIRSNR